MSAEERAKEAIQYIEDVCRKEHKTMKILGHGGHINGILSMLPSLKGLLAELAECRAENERYRAALRHIASCHPNSGLLLQAGNIAKEALGE